MAGHTVLVAQHGGEIVGHAFASGIRPPVLFVVRLYVAAAHQGRGIGTQLLHALADAHPEAQVPRLFVISGNEAAMRFYERRGFTAVGEAEEDGIHSLRLERALPL